MKGFSIKRKNTPEYINWDHFNIEDNNSSTVLINVETINEDIQGDIDKLSKLKNMSNLINVKIISSDYRVAKYFSTLLTEMSCEKEFVLLDDYENKDRSYIDFSNLGYNSSSVPYVYLQWGISKGKYDYLNGSNRKVEESEYGFLKENFEVADQYEPTEEDLFLINEFIEKAKQIPDLNTIDKVVMATNYLQSKVQYVLGKKTRVLGKNYITESFDKGDNIDSVSSVFNQNFGVCGSISRALVLLLNNLEMDVNCRIARGNNHSYCVLYLDDKAYAVDPTWLTTRNKNKLPETLKATEFSQDYLLVGEDVIRESDSHKLESELLRPFEKEKLDREIIFESIKKLREHGIEFEYSSLPTFESKIEREDKEKAEENIELTERD